MSDVISYVRAGQQVNNGGVYAYSNIVDPYSNIMQKDVKANVDSLDAQYTDRFDDSQVRWDDLRIVPTAFSFAGSSDPTLTTWTVDGVTYRVYIFRNTDEAFFTVQMPHTYKEGTNLRPHVHWTNRDRGADEGGGYVKWNLDYSIANVNGQFDASNTVAMSGVASSTNDYHHVARSDVEIDGSNLKVSFMMKGRIYRTTGDDWVGNANGTSPAMLEVDFHFQTDSDGSRQEYIK